MSKNNGRVYIIGAGLAGLACGVALAKKNVPVSIYESAAYAGGRCRSWFDEQLGCTIDNGNHLILSANRNTLQFAKWIEGACTQGKGLRISQAPVILINPKTQAQFLLRNKRTIAGISWMDHLRLARLVLFPGNKTVQEFFVPESKIYKNIVDPLCVSALNTPSSIASSKLFSRVMKAWAFDTKSGSEFRLPTTNFGDALIDPAIKIIEQAGGIIHLQQSLKSIELNGNRVVHLQFSSGKISLSESDTVILAAPPSALEKIHPALALNLTYQPIVNGHFMVNRPNDALAQRDFIGLIDSPAHWLFFKDNMISTTTSAASDMLGMDHETIAHILWREIRMLFPQLTEAMPPHRIIIEKRATFESTPQNDAKRPSAHTPFQNAFFVGDYVQTGMPATIESAITSGFMAAALAHSR